MSKKKKFRFTNEINISGIVTKKDDFVNAIPFPVFGFEIKSPKQNIDTIDSDNEHDLYNFHRCIIFNNDTFINEIDIGDELYIKGEIQSRNYYQTHPIYDDEVQNAVDLYMNLLDELPCEKQPTQFFRQPIQWSKLFEYNFLEKVPTDSAIDENQNLNITETTPYLYKLDWNGEVSRETQETIYEIIVLDYKKIDNEDEKQEYGNINEVIFEGRLATDPLFDFEELTPKTTFVTQAYLAYFREQEKRYAFVPFETFGELAEDVFKNYRRNDFVQIKGEFESREIEKTLRIKKKNGKGKTVRKKVQIKEIERTVYVTDIKKQQPDS